MAGKLSGSAIQAGTITFAQLATGPTLNTATANITTIVTGNALTLSTGTGSNANIIFSANGAEDMRITAPGNIGIGTTNPDVKLHLFGSASQASQRIRVQSHDTASANAGIEFYGRDGSNVNKVAALLTANANLCIHTDNTERVRITDTGSVGIGTTNPLQILHVQGDHYVSGNIGVGVTSFSSFGSVFSTNSKGAHFQHPTSGGWGLLRLNGTAAGGSDFYIAGGGGSGSGAYLWNTANTPLFLGTNATTRILITGVGDVGIGTTDPGRRLDILNSGSDSRVVLIRRGAQGNDPSLSTSFGRPYLQIGGIEYRTNSIQSIGFGWQQTAGGTNPPGEIGFVTTSISSYTLGDLVFGTRDVVTDTPVTERMRITSQGYITTPYQPSFSAYLSDAWGHPSGVTLVTGTFLTHHNTGGHYSTSTRRFTAPISGVYKFDCIIATIGGTGSFSYLSAEIWVNGVRTRIGGWGGGGSSYGETASSYVVKLNAGDYAELGCESSKSFTLQNGSTGHTMFSGYLIG